MKSSAAKAFLALATFGLLAGPQLRAAAPDAGLDEAVKSANFAPYYSRLTAWLNEKSPAAADITQDSLKAALKDPAFANALAQRQLLDKIDVANMNSFARASDGNKNFLTSLLGDTDAMTLLLEGATPLGAGNRRANQWKIPVQALETWEQLRAADPDAQSGLLQRLAIAVALSPPSSGNRGAGMIKTPGTSLARYQHFKTAHANGELFPSFDHLTVWEYRKVVGSCASDADLAWARQMIDAWRPDLRINEQVVNSTSEVWRRNSPVPYTDYTAVLAGGGKCGPRSSWSVMICQAFGIPAIGVGQPQHACVAYKTAYPMMQPQPGSAWKVGYGRGWQVSRLEGMGGIEFLSEANFRDRRDDFSLVEHLHWLASALSGDRPAAVLAVAQKIEKSAPAKKTDVTASLKPEEAEKEVAPKATSTTAAKPAAVELFNGKLHIDAVNFDKMSGVQVYDCYTGGKQVNYQKSLDDSWVQYTIDVPASGDYALELRLAAANYGQVLKVSIDDGQPATVKVPYSKGLWTTSEPVVVKLEQGKQTLRVSAPNQRGVAFKWLELTRK